MQRSARLGCPSSLGSVRQEIEALLPFHFCPGKGGKYFPLPPPRPQFRFSSGPRAIKDKGQERGVGLYGTHATFESTSKQAACKTNTGPDMKFPPFLDGALPREQEFLEGKRVVDSQLDSPELLSFPCGLFKKEESHFQHLLESRAAKNRTFSVLFCCLDHAASFNYFCP